MMLIEEAHSTETLINSYFRFSLFPLSNASFQHFLSKQTDRQKQGITQLFYFLYCFYFCPITHRPTDLHVMQYSTLALGEIASISTDTESLESAISLFFPSIVAQRLHSDSKPINMPICPPFSFSLSPSLHLRLLVNSHESTRVTDAQFRGT